MSSPARTPRESKFIMWVLIICLVLTGVATIAEKFKTPSVASAPVNVPQLATPAPEVAKQTPVDTPIKTPNGSIKAYPAAVKNGIKLPQAVKDDDALQVVTSSRIEADDHPRTITSLIDVETGKFQTYETREPLPWFAWNHKTEIGMFAGVANGTPAVRLEARQSLFKIKAVHFGGIATVDQPISGPIDTNYFVGVGGWISN
jgi:hypothetical protein